MDHIYNVAKFSHVISFAFMSIPLFNLIIVNERALMGPSLNYATDRYFENIIKRGAIRCYVFQCTVFLSGIVILFLGPGLNAIWSNWILTAKTLILLLLMSLLSYVHFSIQPKIESLLGSLSPTEPASEDLPGKLAPFRILRKKLATVCLFLVITAIILGVQTYSRFHPFVSIALVLLAAGFSLRANKSLIRFGWF
ncbi:MAG: hypothetical protein QF835_04760 [Candidatus Marinimicrobia bacterium]|jgi:hypothetical protein|nr:hypothetical protein [Candidatus Neomarinimicrobiota bacterium]MDP6820087.1 hypothetical protein [Candidatus Neomarinimicrobiota bacterium]